MRACPDDTTVFFKKQKRPCMEEVFERIHCRWVGECVPQQQKQKSNN